MMSKFIGLVSAYAYAKSKGYTGTEEEFAILMAEYASVTETAVEAVRIATESAQSAAAASSDVNRTAATVTQQAAQVHDDAETSSENAAAASEAKETAVDKALDSEAYALGTRDGEDVGSGDPAYHNNAKYYAEQGGASAQTASEAAQTATTKAGEAAQSASAAAESARTLTIDATLAQSGQAADAKATGEVKESVASLKTDLEAFPETAKTVTISDFVQGYRHNQSGAAIRPDSGYTTTENPIEFKAGDVLTRSTDQGIAYFLVNTDGTYYKTYPPTGYVFPEDVTVYIDCGKAGITPETTPDCSYATKAVTAKIAEHVSAVEATVNRLDNLSPVYEERQKQGDASVKRGYHVRNGVETATQDYLCCTDFFQCAVGDVFLILNGNSVSRYNTSKTFTTKTDVSEMPLYSGGQRWNVWICDNDGYVRFTLFWTEPVMCAVTKLNLTDHFYECVSLGDSIFGNNQKPFDLPTYMQAVTNLMTANCGFGGTTAATHFNSVYTPLSFWSIADAINTGDWSAIDVDWNQIGNDHVFMPNVYILCHLLDWSKVKTLTVAYGTNDWNGNVAIDNSENKYDVTTYKGALRYGIEKIQSKYPQINIILLSPIFRYWSNSQDYSTVDDTSDTRINGGRKLTDYVTAMGEVANEYHLPYYDNYNSCGINALTAPSILRDGTHLNYGYGVRMVGKQIGAEVAERNRLI